MIRPSSSFVELKVLFRAVRQCKGEVKDNIKLVTITEHVAFMKMYVSNVIKIFNSFVDLFI